MIFDNLKTSVYKVRTSSFLFAMQCENISDQIIMGIDPGTRVMGYAFLQVCQKKLSVLEMGVLTFSNKDMTLRLKTIFEDITVLVDKFKPDIMAIEEPFYGKNVQSMLKLGRVQGIAMAIALHREIPVFEYTPRKVKQSVTGNGNASKEQVASMLSNLLHISATPDYFDATDALGIALCHHYQNMAIVSCGKSSDWAKYITKLQNRIVSDTSKE